MEMSSFIIAILIIASSTWAWRVLHWVWIKPRKLEMCLRQQGLNGNSYKLLVGDLKRYSDLLREANSTPGNISDDICPRVSPFLHESITKYGKSNFMWLGPTPLVNITDLELVKDVLLQHNDFQKPKANPLAKLLVAGLVTYEGDKWDNHRRIINPAFHSEKLKHMLPAFCTSCSLMLEEWEKSVPGDEPREVDVWPYLQNMTGDVISRTAFGSSYEEGERIFKLLRELTILFMQVSRLTYIPGCRFVPTKKSKMMKNMDKEIRVLIKSIIDKREKAMEIGEARTNDLLGLLINSNLKEITEHGNVGMSTQEVIEECKLFYVAGQATTLALLAWTMILLGKHQDWQKLARDEVSLVFGKEKPNAVGLNHLKIVTMILYEVLRLYPPAVAIPRKVVKDTKLGNLHLPAGVLVSLPTMLIHRDQEEWGPDALEFNPGRFAEGVSKATKSQFAFFPFGGGPKICIGSNFAMMEAKVTMAIILQRFSFQIATSYVHAPVSVLTLRPQFGVQLMLHKL